ncbi:MAG: hypothetical protein U5N86_00255 [Planctomycetota bacterium]|nr:hypothetical protein [Planctomycetota bacterium]
MTRKKRYTGPESLHLYCERLEDIYKVIMGMLKYEGDYRPKYTDKWQLMVWAKEEEQKAASFEFCNFTNTAGAKIDGVLHTTWDSDQDDYLHHKLAVAATNLAVDDYGGIVEYFPDWIREATAHYVEQKIFDELRIFSGGEGGFSANCPTHKLKVTMRKAVKADRRQLSPFSEIINKKMVKITGWERLKCWSIVDWMVNAHEDDKLGRFIKHMKKMYPQEKNKRQGPSFREVFEMTPPAIEEEWKAWVMETDPTV